MNSHNICKLHASGVCVTINSDDPPYFGGYINKNYAAIQAALGVTDEDLWQMARNSFTSAYMPEDLRVRYLSELDRHHPKSGIQQG
jgi:adenosine deaminase